MPRSSQKYPIDSDDDENTPLHLADKNEDEYIPLRPMSEDDDESPAASLGPDAVGDGQRVALSKQTRAILDRQLNGIPSTRNHQEFSLWPYATKRDKMAILVSSMAGLVAGAANPFISVRPLLSQSSPFPTKKSYRKTDLSIDSYFLAN
ncbi:hypothetical protein COCMIDRAFT_107902 [Bipolaris oryzae ATCC 44560]|uniref:Uncharacterized protein n=1 Tax=Bipolaris oryzae ATCC 44560 TaxID=930090 RepID=W6ZAP7_COCMI|nr:uncharacterized protein COCMIDRAFT_107902 [Bipolaris oryzae ATCC 44560]EUC40776.1 hypothetical protein COCMIDRAFT_107902 [Bipolaris oryzae ATCC 44560]